MSCVAHGKCLFRCGIPIALTATCETTLRRKPHALTRHTVCFEMLDRVQCTTLAWTTMRDPLQQQHLLQFVHLPRSLPFVPLIALSQFRQQLM